MTPVASPRHLLPDGRMGVLLSGDSPAQLRAEAAAVAAYLREHPRVTPAEVADMLARSRRVRRHRALAAVSGPADLVSALDAVAANEPDDRATVGERPARPRRIALVYPGQGSQRPGMGRLFYTSSSAYAEVVDACEDILRREHSMSVRDYLLGDLPADAPQAGDVRTVQPALLAQMLGITAMWRSVGVVPHAVIGHSQGEIAAAHVSGAIPLADALRVVVTRARLLAAFGTDEHRVALLGISPKDCTRLLARSDGRAELSVVNAPEAVCVSGDAGPVAELVDTVRASGRFAREIGLSFPAHTSRMWALKDDLITDLHHHLEYPTFRPPAIECFSSALGGERITGGLDAGRYWFLNLRNVVRFDEAVEAALAAGSTVFVEAAEHPTLQSAVEATVGAAGLPERPLVVGTSRRDAQDLSEFTRALGAVAVDDELFDWSVLRGAADAARTLPLPGFPNTVLTERPMWAVKQPAARPAITPSQVADGRPPRRWVEAWTPLRRRALIRPTRVVVLDPTGNCAEPAAAIAAQAARHGAVGCRWEPGLPLHRDDVAVVLLPPEPVMDGRAASARLGAYLSGSVEWLPLVDAAGACWVVTVNGEAVGEGEVPQLWHAAAGVASRCLVAQCPSTRFGHLDIDAAVLESPTGAGEILAAVHTAGESELALRDGVLHAKRLERADRDTEPGDLTEVVIVGGTGRVGLEFAQDLARRGAGRITLLNRSGERRDLAGPLARLRAGRTTVEVVACDVADPDAVLAFAATRRERPATLLVHAAVDYVHAVAGAGLDHSAVERAAAAKIVGIENVVEALPLAATARVILCSSVAATFAGPGLAVYAATNRMLDAIAARLRADGIDGRSVQWGVWHSTARPRGEYDDIVAGSERAGILPMPPAAALAAGLTAESQNSLTLSADWTVIAAVCELNGMPALMQDFGGQTGAAVRSVPADASPERVRSIVARVMGLGVDDVLDPDTPLVALGMDSIQALELYRSIQQTLRLEIPVARVLGGATLHDVLEMAGKAPATVGTRLGE